MFVVGMTNNNDGFIFFLIQWQYDNKLTDAINRINGSEGFFIFYEPAFNGHDERNK